MAQGTSIEWTEATWNTVTGCTRASAGCDNCYAVTMTRRLEAMGQDKYAGLVNSGKQHFNGVVKCHDEALMEPLRRRKPTTYFVNSMGDTFHKDVPFEFIDRMFAVMAMCPQHTFQVLTKRPERMAQYFAELRGGRISTEVRVATELDFFGEDDAYFDRSCRAAAGILNGDTWPLPNVWLMTTVEDQSQTWRITELLKCPAVIRGLSCEPLIAPLSLRWLAAFPENAPTTAMNPHNADRSTDELDGLRRLDWVIVGGESGHGARPMKEEWALTLRDQCQTAGVAFHFKQWGAHGPDGIRCDKHANGRTLNGQTWDELPAARLTA